MNLKIKITLETKRLLLLRRQIKTKFWCNQCGAETDFAPETEIFDILAKLNQAEHLHRLLTSEGTTLICLESLSQEGK